MKIYFAFLLILFLVLGTILQDTIWIFKHCVVVEKQMDSGNVGDNGRIAGHTTLCCKKLVKVSGKCLTISMALSVTEVTAHIIEKELHNMRLLAKTQTNLYILIRRRRRRPRDKKKQTNSHLMIVRKRGVQKAAKRSRILLHKGLELFK